ncbi:MAG: hypothetical protein R2769_15885 [Saprospiraceae bacterium]
MPLICSLIFNPVNKKHFKKSLTMAITDNQEVFDRIAKMLEEANFKVASNDFNRPWGGFL